MQLQEDKKYVKYVRKKYNFEFSAIAVQIMYFLEKVTAGERFERNFEPLRKKVFQILKCPFIVSICVIVCVSA